MRSFLVVCLLVFTSACAALAQDSQNGNASAVNVVSYAPAEPAAVPATPQVLSVSDYKWQLGLGYQFSDFHLQHSPIANAAVFHNSGYNVSVVRYFNDWIGLEGQTGFGFGHTGSTTIPNNLVIKSTFVGGGPRFAMRGHRVEPWGHGLVGVEHFRFSQTANGFGSNSTVGWLAGGGVDFLLSDRVGIRVEADYLGTEFFSTNHRNLQIVTGFVMHL